MFSLPDLPYSFQDLEPYIDRKTMVLHHDKHHAAYVKNVNDALAGREDLLSMDIDMLLQSLEKVPESVRTKVRNNAGGHANHCLFWTIMTPKSPRKPMGNIAEAIEKTFEGYPLFKEKFSQAAAGMFGSGWAWLVLNGKRLEIITTPNQDSPIMQKKIPVLGLDVWEHAYYLKYQNRRPEYISQWWNIVNWEEVDRRYREALS